MSVSKQTKVKGSGKKKNTERATRSMTCEEGPKSGRQQKKKEKKAGPLKIGTGFEGQINYIVQSCIRNPGPYAEYYVKDGTDNIRNLRLEPLNRCKLKMFADILKKVKDNHQGDDRYYTLEYIEHGATPKHNYLITSVYDIQLVEIGKVLKAPFTPACILNIALQTLEAIRTLHNAGFINRNIKPASFSVGTLKKHTEIYLSDYRITRQHIDEATKSPKEARKRVAWVGTARYASLAALKEVDQGRKDDIESWIYMLYEMFDANLGITWRYLSKDKIIREKEAFKTHAKPQIYKAVPEEFKKLIDMINAYKYESTPEYEKFKEVIEQYATSKSLVTTTCDWLDKLTPEVSAQAIDDAVVKSPDAKCSGEDDFEGAPKKKKPPIRKIMNPNDIIKNGSFTWKVVVLLGSGGFGDVYKVYNEKDAKKTNYALKTESEEGKKIMLRLKVEMQVMMAIADARKAKTSSYPHKHFVEFVDRGKSEELKCKYIVMSLVGPSLEDCRKKYRVDLSEKHTPYVIAIQTLEAVRDLHALGYLHRDIKPANFAVGIGADEPTVYMLDFGICRSFMDPKTKQHRAPRKVVKFLGTLRFASRACMKQIDQGRKDDLECWLYLVFDILDEDGGIPWKKCPKREKILAIKQLFFQNKIDSCYDNITRKMKVLVAYIDSLEYQSIPDYEYIEKRLYQASDHCGWPVTMKRVEWLGKLKSLPTKTERFDVDDSESEVQSGSEDEG